MNRDLLKIGIVGATGLVGRTALKVLQERGFSADQVILFATDKNTDRWIQYGNRKVQVSSIPESPPDLDFALFCAPARVAVELVPKWSDAGIRCIDNSSTFRMQEGIPLVVPEVNRDEIGKNGNIVANPNCSSIQLAVALNPLQKTYGIHRLSVSTYQSISGAGLKALKQWESEIEGVPRGDSPFPRAIHGNVIPQIGQVNEDGYNEEETKLHNELPKIFGDSSFGIAATSVRVPVAIGHSEAVEVTLRSVARIEEVVEILMQGEGIILQNSHSNYPTPLDVANRDEVFVGRVRRHPREMNTFLFWIVSDNLRKGAATNAVQILEHWIQLAG
ncbi:aspartate-semialdehyde dehydrogenase [bacterium]|nr:aspartate-semialdehyde dehydrogenase [bacterium]